VSLTLYLTRTSPFARKVRIALIELGLHQEVEEVVIDPYAAGPEYFSVNPLSKVPTLVTREGEILPDSRLILDYLHSLDATLLREQERSDRWRARRLQQYADGLIDAATTANLERHREPAQFSSRWFDRHEGAIARTLDRLDAEADALRVLGAITPTEISAAVALGYLDLRFPERSWRKGRANLANWYLAFAQRPSIRETTPPA